MTKQELFELLQQKEINRLEEELDHAYDLDTEEADYIVDEIRQVRELGDIAQFLNYLQNENQEGMSDSEIVDYILDVFPDK